MFRIIIKSALDFTMESIITESQLKEIIRLLEQSQLYRLESLERVEYGIEGEELVDLLKREVKPSNLEF